MHINWKIDRSLPTAANYVLETETIPPNEEGQPQVVQKQTYHDTVVWQEGHCDLKEILGSFDESKYCLSELSISKEGYTYMTVFTDEATKQCWSYMDYTKGRLLRCSHVDSSYM
jgi:hypothetical protein